MHVDFVEIGKASLILFAVIDIIGSIPLIIDLKQKAGQIQAGKAALVSMLIMFLFLFIGEQLLNLIGIDVKSFAVAGAFVLFFMALEMILGIQLFKESEDIAKTVSVVPLAFPLIAGAGTMTSLLALRAEFQTVNIAVAIVINILVVFLVLRLTKRIERVLGRGGIAVLKKVFGIILLAMAVKLFSTNIKGLFA